MMRVRRLIRREAARSDAMAGGLTQAAEATKGAPRGARERGAFASAQAPGSGGHPALASRYRAVRQHTEHLAAALTDEDQCVQSMPDASPAKWHRAHTTWFFETFILQPNTPGYRAFDPAFAYLFNSYYETLGARHPRPQRGMLTRPGATRVGAYRAHVDQAMETLLGQPGGDLGALIELGLQHEQQHQELLVTDMVHAFAQNPLLPAMLPEWREPRGAPGPTRMIAHPGGTVRIGHAGEGFTFDSETPRHAVLLAPFHMASRLVRNAEYLGFIEDGGYRSPTLWMSDGFAAAQEGGWTAPLHWRREDGGGWKQFGPGGLAPLDPDAPVRHLSWYEADAFARWAGARLPTEAEWEAMAEEPQIAERTSHVWQWTASAYAPYPGFRPVAGAVGEYNGKFMVNQMVLRGGSLATPLGHARPSYRNFFHPDRRWQFAGLRLAGDG
jgi:ergothioneine biosynthesis protein EgtB